MTNIFTNLYTPYVNIYQVILFIYKKIAKKITSLMAVSAPAGAPARTDYHPENFNYEAVALWLILINGCRYWTLLEPWKITF